MTGVVQDVTEEHRAAEQLREQLDFIQRIASNIPGFIYQCRIQPDGKPSLPYVSEAVEGMMGVSDHIVRQDIQTLERSVLPEDLPLLRRAIRRAVRTLKPWHCEYRVLGADGSVRWHMTSAALQAEPDGAVLMHGYARCDRPQRAQLRRSNAWRSTTPSRPCPTAACCWTACNACCSAASARASTARCCSSTWTTSKTSTTPWATTWATSS
jgi:PAS domain-containing protein